MWLTTSAKLGASTVEMDCCTRGGEGGSNDIGMGSGLLVAARRPIAIIREGVAEENTAKSSTAFSRARPKTLLPGASTRG